MPALPLGEAGKYVAAAYVVFRTIVVLYVAIMARKLGKIEREIESIRSDADRTESGGEEGER